MNPRSLPPFIAATLLTLAFGLAVLLGQTGGPSLTLLGREGRRAMPITIVSDQEFVGLDDLASTFQLNVQESLGAITVTYRGQTIVLTPDQSLASVAGRLISLPAAPSRQGRRWLVPVEFISRALSPIYDSKLELRKPSRLLIVGEFRVPRLSIRYDAVGIAGRLTIDATPRVATNVSQDGDHISVKFDADALDTSSPLFQPPSPPGLVQAIRIVEPTTVVVDLVPRFGGFKASTLSVGSSGRLVLDIAPPPPETSPTPTTGATTPSPTPAPASPGAPPELPPALVNPVASVRTIAIDPGHGGDDEGAKGANGVKEKDLALAIARRLRATLEARLGVRVLLTRDDDRNVPIDERAAVANNNKADIFVSLHANASTRPATSGAAVYRAAFDKDTLAAEMRPPQRLQTFGGGLRDVEMVPWDLAQSRHVSQSAAFADMLVATLKDHVPMSARANDQAPLRVLESANMPAVLVELGYLSNPAQEKAIAGDAFQAGFVQAFYDAVVRYRGSIGGAQ
ncbi:MAG TPA: N-acetylmuramoyl-L-alanine amidase [Vicinamibacterales bacterium]